MKRSKTVFPISPILVQWVEARTHFSDFRAERPFAGNGAGKVYVGSKLRG